MHSAAKRIDPPEVAATRTSNHIAERRQWLGGFPVMHRNRLTRDSLLQGRRTTLLRPHEADAD